MVQSPPSRGAGSGAKAQARRALLAARRALVATREREADDLALAARVDDLVTTLELSVDDTVAAYEALRSEPPTAATIARLDARGIRVIVPITLDDNDLDWCEATDPARTALGRDAIATARLILAPGLAADVTGTRLGRGGGSYDRALARRGADATVLVVLHPGELHEHPLPADPHDQGVDGILTVDGPIRT